MSEIRKCFISWSIYTPKEFVLVTGASSAEVCTYILYVWIRQQNGTLVYSNFQIITFLYILIIFFPYYALWINIHVSFIITFHILIYSANYSCILWFWILISVCALYIYCTYIRMLLKLIIFNLCFTILFFLCASVQDWDRCTFLRFCHLCKFDLYIYIFYFIFFFETKVHEGLSMCLFCYRHIRKPELV